MTGRDGKQLTQDILEMNLSMMALKLHSRHGSGGRSQARSAVHAFRSKSYWIIGVI